MDVPVIFPPQLRPLLRSLRKSRGLTQRELARRLGVGQSRVAAIERDPGAVSTGQLLDILTLLGAQVVVRTNEPAGPAPPPQPSTPSSTRRPLAQGPDEPKGEW